jgi:hypothetical protein
VLVEILGIAAAVLHKKHRAAMLLLPREPKQLQGIMA